MWVGHRRRRFGVKIACRLTGDSQEYEVKRHAYCMELKMLVPVPYRSKTSRIFLNISSGEAAFDIKLLAPSLAPRESIIFAV
jgi:hypothetical protein